MFTFQCEKIRNSIPVVKKEPEWRS